MMGVPVICVFASDIIRQYYCFRCWQVISERAAVDIPQLSADSDADMHTIGLMFGIKAEQARDQRERSINGLEKIPTADLRIRPDGSTYLSSDIDMYVDVPMSLIEDNIVFKRYHLTGDELTAYKAAAQETVDNGS